MLPARPGAREPNENVPIHPCSPQGKQSPRTPNPGGWGLLGPFSEQDAEPRGAAKMHRPNLPSATGREGSGGFVGQQPSLCALVTASQALQTLQAHGEKGRMHAGSHRTLPSATSATSMASFLPQRGTWGH